MKRNALKFTALGGAIVFIILYGIEMSSTGIERIYGPIEGGEAYVEMESPIQTKDPSTRLVALKQQAKIAELEKQLEEVKRLALLAEKQDDRLLGIPFEGEQPAVNKIADSTSGMLQNVSSEGIRFVVSLFDGLTK